MTIDEMQRIRQERGYSYRKLSEYSGVPMVTLQKVLTKVTANPRKATLDAIERVLQADEEIYKGKAFEYSTVASTDASIVEDSGAAYNVKKRQGSYTLKDYFALPEEKRFELIDGTLYDMASPRTVHQDIVALVHMEFFNYIRTNKKSCKVLEAPVDVQLCCDNKTMVQPDLMVVCDRDKIRGFGIYGAPDFVLEVLSASTKRKDKGIKYSKYMEAGVREYWIIDPDKQVLIVYHFEDEDFIPKVYPLEGKVPVAISGGELMVDLDQIAESIRELGALE